MTYQLRLILLICIVYPLILCLPKPADEEANHQIEYTRKKPQKPQPSNSQTKACQADQSFGYVLLALQWAPSFCNNTQCGTRNRNGWTIHGAWPQHINNSWPQYCCFESEFDATKIEALKEELMLKWPSLKASGTHTAFWKHEWTKHGTCAMNSDRLRGHYNYFNQTLRIYDQFPLQSWLNSSGLTPSSSKPHKISDIHEVMNKKLGAKVELECLPKKPYPLLQHIYICLDRVSLRPIDCFRKDDKQCGNSTVLMPLAQT